MKEFLKEWTEKNIKRMDKDDRAGLLYDYIPEIVEFVIKKGHNPKFRDTMNELYDRMKTPKFVKTLTRVVKGAEDYAEIDPGLATVIAGFIERNHQDLDEDTIQAYTNIIDRLLKKRIKKLNKKLGLDKDLLKELLVVVAEPDNISDERFVGIYVHKMLRKLYALAKDTEADLGLDKTKTVKKLFKSLFNEDLINSIAINILLEKKQNIRNFNEKQQAVWNIMTDFALETLESNSKKEIRKLLENYVERRSNDAEKNRDEARRIQLAALSEEDYPGIYAACKKLAEKEKYAKYL